MIFLSGQSRECVFYTAEAKRLQPYAKLAKVKYDSEVRKPTIKIRSGLSSVGTEQAAVSFISYNVEEQISLRSDAHFTRL
jgi:hypothetical protein